MVNALKFIKQYDESDCGPACLTMLAIYFGKNTMISRVREWSKTDKEGTSLYGLIKGGEKLGINLTGVRADKISDIKKDELPVIAHIINEKGFMHFIIVEKVTDKNIFILDPAKGKEKLSFAEFEKLWTGVLMLVQNDYTYGYDNDVPSKMKLFGRIIQNNKFIIINILILSIIINLLGIAGAFYFKMLVDNIIPSQILKIYIFYL